MKKCEIYREMFDDYVMGKLDATTSHAIDEHLKICEECRAVLEEDSLIISALRSMPAPEAPTALRERVRHQIARKKQKRTIGELIKPWLTFPRLRLVGQVAALFLCLYIGWNVIYMPYQRARHPERALRDTEDSLPRAGTTIIRGIPRRRDKAGREILSGDDIGGVPVMRDERAMRTAIEAYKVDQDIMRLETTVMKEKSAGLSVVSQPAEPVASKGGIAGGHAVSDLSLGKKMAQSEPQRPVSETEGVTALASKEMKSAAIADEDKKMYWSAANINADELAEKYKEQPTWFTPGQPTELKVMEKAEEVPASFGVAQSAPQPVQQQIAQVPETSDFSQVPPLQEQITDMAELPQDGILQLQTPPSFPQKGQLQLGDAIVTPIPEERYAYEGGVAGMTKSERPTTMRGKAAFGFFADTLTTDTLTTDTLTTMPRTIE